MAWIKFEKDLLTDPRVLKVARAMQKRWKLQGTIAEAPGYEIGNGEALPGVTLVCGALVRIWSLADTHLGADDHLPLGIEEINAQLGIPGFCELLPADWLIVIDENTVKLPDFHKHNGTEAKKKAVTQKRVEKFRSGTNVTALQPRNASALPDQDQTKTRPEVKDLSSAPPKTDPIPYQAIVNFYNATMAKLPKVREVTDARKTLVRKAWQSSEKRRTAEFWKAYFEECADDSFLNGAGPYRNGHENWQPSFDYLLQDKVVTRVFEKAMDRLDREAAA